MLRWLFPLLLLVFPLTAHALDAAEKARIEALIAYVDGLDDAVFIRNGSEYDAHKAADHLRAKWKQQDDEVHTAADFIRLCGTKSSMSGKDYAIRCNGQPERPCAEILSEELRRIETASQAAGK